LQNPRNTDELIAQITELAAQEQRGLGPALFQRIAWLIAACEQLQAQRTLHMVWDEDGTLTVGGIAMARVTRQRSGAGWVYSAACALPGAHIPTTLLPLQKAREKAEKTVREWFDRASRAPGPGLGLERTGR
jgi:hypothetical protein